MTTAAAAIFFLSPSAGRTTAASPAFHRSFPPSSPIVSFPTRRRPRRSVSCEVVLSNDAPSSSSSSGADALVEGSEGESQIGARVRVKVPLKVYHAQRVGEEVELEGVEGVIKQYVAVWKGKRISANMPFKVEFVKEVEGRGEVKFVAHLKDDEFEFV